MSQNLNVNPKFCISLSFRIFYRCIEKSIRHDVNCRCELIKHLFHFRFILNGIHKNLYRTTLNVVFIPSEI